MNMLLRWPLVASLLVVAGCASYPHQRGLEETAALARQRGLPAPADAALACVPSDPVMAAILAEPLGVEQAVTIVLACNPGLAAEYARLGIARAEAVEASRLANPELSLGRVGAEGDSGTTVKLGLAQNFSQLILRGPRQRLSAAEFLRTQQLLAGSVLRTVAETHAAWHRAQVAEQVAVIAGLSADAAEAAAELSRRFRDAGNRSQREVALDEVLAVDATLDARKARDQASVARTELQAVLGLPADARWKLPETMSLPPRDERLETPALQQMASQRLDLVAARGLVQLLADSRETTRRWRWLGEFDVGVEFERERGGARTKEPRLSIQLPVFNRGDATLAKAQAWQEWSEAEHRRLELQVANEVAMRALALQSAAADVADHRDRLLPQRRSVVARTQEDVNYMLRGPFELVQSRRDEYAAAIGYVEAIGGYWIARAELQQAVGAVLPEPAGMALIGVDDLVGVSARSDGDPAIDHSKMDHSKTDHSKMDHSKMDHSKMDHSKMDHSGSNRPVGDQP